jgi:hypothetical protein
MDTLTGDNISLSNMLSDLCKIDDEEWGQYAFSRDILKDRIPNEEKREMIGKSIQCGYEYADKILQETGLITPSEIAKQLGLHVMSNDLPMTGKRVLFAQFTPPDQIEISQEPVEKYKTILAGSTEEKSDLLITESEIHNLLLGHEIFHFLEDQYKDEIYTRTKKIQLWHILNFKNDSTIRALGEIAGMAFSKRLNHIAYSPFLLDVLLFFGYNPEGAKNIYRDIMGISVKQKL